MQKKKWIVGITVESKTVMREYQDDTQKQGLIIHHVFMVNNPDKNQEVKAWVDAMRGILGDSA